MSNSCITEILEPSDSNEKPKNNKIDKPTVIYKVDEQESTTLDTIYSALFEYLTTDTPVVELINRVKYNNL